MNPIQKLMEISEDGESWRGITAMIMLVVCALICLVLVITAIVKWPLVGVPVACYAFYRLYKAVTKEEKTE